MNARPQQLLRATQPSDRSRKGMPEMRQVFRNTVGNGPLEVRPDKFIGIKLGCVPWEEVTVKTTMVVLKSPDEQRPVDRVIIPHQDNVPSKVSEKHLEKHEDLLCSNILVGVKSEVESQSLSSGRDTDCRDSRHPCPIPSGYSHMRSCSFRRPCAGNARYEQEAAFIRKNEMGPKLFSFFLSGAKPDVSTLRWRVRFAPWPVSPASGNSTPVISSRATHSLWSTRPRSASWSLPQYVSVSTDPLRTLPLAAHRTRSAPGAVSAWGTTAEVDLGSALAEGHFDHACGRSDATARRNSGKNSLARPQSGNCDRLSADLWHAAAAFRVLRDCHGVSCPVIYEILTTVSIV